MHPLHGDSIAETEPRFLDPRDFYDFLTRSWKFIFISAGLTCSAFVSASFFVTPSYQATAQILFATLPDITSFHDPSTPELGNNATFVDSQIALLASTSVLQKVVEGEGLQNDKELGPGALAWLKSAIRISRVGLSNAVELSVTCERPECAKSLTNAIADAYVQDRTESRYEAAKEASKWLSERAEVLRVELSRSENAIEQFRIANNLVTTRSGSLTEQQLSELNIALINARADLAAIRSRFQQAEKLRRTGGDVQTIPDVMQSAVISALRTQHATVTRRQADLLSRYGERHPEVMTSAAESRDIEAQIGSEIQRLIGNLQNEVEAAEAREAALARALASVSNQSEIEGHVGVQLRELERIAAANRSLYETFLSRAKVAEERSTLLDAGVRVITRAELPTSPVFPNKPLFAALGLVVGVMFGGAGAFIKELFAPGFLARRQVEEELDIPVLASIPKMLDRTWSASIEAQPGAYLERRPLSRYSEAMRRLRSAIHAASHRDAPPRIVLVTSATVGEGKTTLALSLAYSAAANGEKVLLIDADLRRPAATALFGLTEQFGLVDLLTLPIGLDRAVHMHVDSGISVLPAGATTQNPPSILASNRMRSILEEIRGLYDLVIIDAPPVAPVIDAAVLARHADKIVFAVKWRDTSREVVADGIRQLGSSSSRVGIALTLVDEPKLPRTGRYASLEATVGDSYYAN